ncbi:MAG: FkbM family methyltransferase [Bryobacteraceae bacterium]
MVLKFVRTVFLCAGIYALLASVAIWIYPPAAALLSMRMAIRSPYCTRWSAFRDGAIKVKRLEIAGEIEARSHVVTRDSGLELWSTPLGKFWTPARGGHILSVMLGQMTTGIYRYGDLVMHGDVVIDCGAFVGTMVRQALNHGAQKVVAVEPTPASVECLRRNFVQEIASGRVIICPKGIWDADTVLTLYENGNEGAANSFNGYRDNPTGIQIPVTTIDRLAEELKLERVNVIKADVKGATERMLAGGYNTIRRDHPRLALATEENTEQPDSIARLVAGRFRGYRMECGPCLPDGHDIRTDALFFR